MSIKNVLINAARVVGYISGMLSTSICVMLPLVVEFKVDTTLYLIGSLAILCGMHTLLYRFLFR